VTHDGSQPGVSDVLRRRWSGKPCVQRSGGGVQLRTPAQFAGLSSAEQFRHSAGYANVEGQQRLPIYTATLADTEYFQTKPNREPLAMTG
jgi:hypothetical protein